MTNTPAVTIHESGRSGTVTYREGPNALAFHWEFGGGEVVAMVQCGDARNWERHPWVLARRSEIMRFVADEVIRQKAPDCRAEINEATGDILLRQVMAGPVKHNPPHSSFVRRFTALKARLGLIVLAVALIFGGMICLKDKLLAIDPGKGAPLGLCVRTDHHIATLMQTLEPYTPSLHRDGSEDRFTVSIFIVPLDGSKPRLIPILHEQSFPSVQLAKVLGSDGSTLWFDARGIGGVDLETFELLKPSEVRDPYVPQPALPFAPAVSEYLSAGYHTGPGSWLGLHSAAEIEGGFAPKEFVRRVVRQDEAKQLRRFYRGVLDAPVNDEYHRILSMTAIGDTEYLNAAFLRMDEASEPLRMTDPDGALMIFTSDPGLQGRLMVARVDLDGKVVWKTDTGIDRFKLSQILPGKDSFAFVGTRPPVPNKVSEPLLVIVENRSGKTTLHSLWQ